MKEIHQTISKSVTKCVPISHSIEDDKVRRKCKELLKMEADMQSR